MPKRILIPGDELVLDGTPQEVRLRDGVLDELLVDGVSLSQELVIQAGEYTPMTPLIVYLISRDGDSPLISRVSDEPLVAR